MAHILLMAAAVLGKESYRARTPIGLVAAQAWKIHLNNSCLFIGWSLIMVLEMSFHRLLMGFMSGDWANHCFFRIPSFSDQVSVALAV